MGQGGINEGTRHRCVVGLLGGSGGIKKGKHRYVVGVLGGSGRHWARARAYILYIYNILSTTYNCPCVSYACRKKVPPMSFPPCPTPT